MRKKKKFKAKKPLLFRMFKNTILKIFIKKPKFIYLGDKIEDGSIIVSNHVGTAVPLKLECYFKQPFRFWGAHQMNQNLFKVYGYQSKVYYHQKKHWNLFAARMFCLIAAPLTWCFYRGLRLISTYTDTRFRRTLEESIDTIKHGQSVVIFPEDSSNGYLDEVQSFYSGFVMLARILYKQGIDASIHAMYYNKYEKTFVIDKAIKYSEFVNSGLSQDEIAKKLCDRTNEIAGFISGKEETTTGEAMDEDVEIATQEN